MASPAQADPVNWKRLLEEWFQVPDNQYPDVYILGCFARYVTLYSQQVRALNLVAALHATGRLARGTDVAVIGGGAAGMTAAAAAALLGADVLLLEELEGLMELQRNNRQRWIHPHIYDWPDTEFDGDSARLPVLNWTAGYAESVAQQIIRRFDAVRRNTALAVTTSASGIELNVEDGETTLYCEGEHPRQFPVIILAVGFGLEPERDVGNSYWAEDDFDGSFRRTIHDQEWLVSGFGDGAFTDVMRLCIKHFRHADIKELFVRDASYLGAIDDLREMHRQAITNKELSNAFWKLSAAKSFQVQLEPLLRQDGPRVFLTGKTSFPFGRGASILNRLIVMLLCRLKRVRQIPGPYLSHERMSNGLYRVQLGKSQREFHRIILRHGPTPRALERAPFQVIFEACRDTFKRWQELLPDADITRRRLWPDELFPSLSDGPAARDQATLAFETRVQSLGIRAAAVTVYKQIRSDGSSTVKYEFERLSVEKGELAGVRIAYHSATGVVGPPELDAEGKRHQLRITDVYEPPPGQSDPLDRLLDRSRTVAIIVKFPRPLTPSRPAARFSVSFRVLNADALSSYEYDQMYTEKNLVHVNRQGLKANVEYFSKTVWFPVEHLRLRVTRADSTGAAPVISGFQAEKYVPDEEIVTQEAEGRILHFYPPPASSFHPDRSSWLEIPRGQLDKSAQLACSALQTWDLTVYKPAAGSAYSIDWRVRESSSDSESQTLDASANNIRQKLIAYSAWRQRDASTEASTSRAHAILAAFYADLHGQHVAAGSTERFGLMLRTYDKSQRRMVLVDGVINHQDPQPKEWDFKLPFGLGLAGACFKDGDKPYVYLRPSAEEASSAPAYYLSVPGRDHHGVLLAIPLKPPGLPQQMPADYEPSRSCAGVLDIGSNNANASLIKLVQQREALRECVDQCQDVFRKFCDAFADLGDKQL